MGDEDDGLLQIAPQREQIVVEAEARDLVERCERLVHQEDIRIGDERARQRHPHLHAAGQFARKAVGEFGEPDARQRLLTRGSDSAAGTCASCKRQPHILAHAGPGHQGRLLEHEADALPRQHVALAMRELDAPRARRGKPRDDPQRRRLAAAGGTDQRDELALADGEIERPQRHDAIVIGLGDVAQADRRAAARRHRCRTGRASVIYFFGRSSTPTALLTKRSV